MKRTPTSVINPDTPIRAMRAFCLDCTGGKKAEVRACSFKSCPIHPYRMGKRPPKGMAATPMKTIRKQCLQCCSGSFAEARNCQANACAIHHYRLGRKVPATGGLSSVNEISELLALNHTRNHPERQKSSCSGEV